MKTDYIVGVDAGGTKTRLRFATPDGRTLDERIHPAGEWTALDAPGKALLLDARLRETTARRPLAVAVGAHGCDSDQECLDLRDALAARTGTPVTVVNDAFLLEAAVPHGGPGAGLIVGTGSIAVARTPDGTSLYAGGWGWLLGDPGSAWGTVREAVRLLTRAHDRHGHVDDPLLPLLLRRSGGRDLRDLRDVVDAMQRLRPREWADWAPAVFDAAERGSPAARAAVAKGADDLVDLVDQVQERGAALSRVIAGGAVIAARPLLAERVAARLRARLGLPLTVYSGEPVAGAVRLAHALAAPGPVRGS
ncbi:N-acetylglucosamine kinase [Streptomyces sp. NPDC057654]|uniref:N-acetylglucosamine kinase n=1 Tax=Streptomyces sp. NPDC057654 TaxID=3346196 RepID=UPI0036D0F319